MCHARSAWWLETKSYARRIAPPPPRFTRQPRKKKHSLHFCFGGGEISFEKGKGVFLSGFYPPSIRAVWRGEMRTRQSKTIFAGGKGFALPRLLFQNGGDLISAAQEGAGGMRGGFAFSLLDLSRKI